MTIIQYAIQREAAKLRKFPEARYERWQVITEAADQIGREPAPHPRRIPYTAREREMIEKKRQNRKRTERRQQTDLQTAMDQLRAAGYSVKPPKTDQDLDQKSEEWLTQHGSN